ncbi:MAG: HAD-IA family hydrolase [Anaeromyxobacter sp.]
MDTAAIFDLNGTVVDDMPVHAELWRALGLSLGRDVPASVFLVELAGANDTVVLTRILGRPPTPEELVELPASKERAYHETYRHRVAEVPGCLALLRELRDAGVPLALATLAPAPNRALVLDALQLHGTFDRIVGAEHVTRGKPAPDIFLAAAAGLGVAPERCVVFEDALNGIRAARAANMYAVGVTTAVDGPALVEAGAHEVMADFRALPAPLRARLGLAVRIHPADRT